MGQLPGVANFTQIDVVGILHEFGELLGPLLAFQTDHCMDIEEGYIVRLLRRWVQWIIMNTILPPPELLIVPWDI